MIWHCPNCGTPLESGFDACWHCGATRNGEPDPEFVPEIELTDAGTEPAWTPPQYGLALCLISVTCLAIVIGLATAVNLRAAAVAGLGLVVLLITEDRMRGLDSAVRARVLGLLAVVILFLVHRASK